MGLSPEEVGRCSLWAFGQALKGFARFHGATPDSGGAPSDEAFTRAVLEARRADLQASGKAG